VPLRLRRRRNGASAPIPNSATIGGSGTLVPELVLVLELVELELLVEVLEVTLPEVELLVDVLEVMLPEVELLVDTLPDDDVVLVTLPELVEVELPPVEVEVDEPPVEVDVELPLTLITVPLLPEDEPLVLVLVVVLTSRWPPLLEPPKKPPKKPPPPNPPEPPMITGVLPPPLQQGAAAGSGTAIGAIANCCVAMHSLTPLWSTIWLGASHEKVTSVWTRWMVRGTTRRCSTLVYFTGRGVLVYLVYLTYLLETPFAGASATCTAPPTASAPPAATADSFARAIRTDMVVLSAIGLA
jgi:hypothetical protein